MSRDVFVVLTCVAAVLVACDRQRLVEPTTPEDDVTPTRVGAEAEAASGTLIYSTVAETEELNTWSLDLGADRAQPQPIAPGFLAASMSPDGALLAGLLSDGSLWAVRRANGDVTPLPEGYHNVTFLDSSRFVVCNRDESGAAPSSEIRLVDLDQQSDQVIYASTDIIWDDVPLGLTPEGEAVTFFERASAEGMYALDLGTGEASHLAPGAMALWSPDGARFATITRGDNRRTDLYSFDGSTAQVERTLSEAPSVALWLDNDRLVLLEARERGVGDAKFMDLTSGEERPVAHDVHFGEAAVRGWGVVVSGDLYYLGADQGEGMTLRRVSLEGEPESSVALATSLGVEAVILGVVR